MQRDYINPRTSKNLRRINEELSQVHDIMRENLADIMSRGTSLEKIYESSSQLKDVSAGFKKKAKWINVQAQLQQYAIPCACVSVILLVLLFRYWFS